MAQITRTKMTYQGHSIQFAHTKGHPLGPSCDGWRYSINGDSWSKPYIFLNDAHTAVMAECDTMGGQERGSGVQCVVCGVAEPHEVCYEDLKSPNSNFEGSGALSSLAHSAVMRNERNKPY
jgi:hypothetical protein